MTSNLGAGRSATFGLGPSAPVSYRSEALSFFRPEFFNRIDEVVTFQPLGPDTIRAITRKELTELTRREGLTRLGLHVEWTPALEDHLSRVGFDAELGARPLQRAIEQQVVAPLARFLLERPEVRDAVVLLDAKDGLVEITA
jgi:ATP-dependent Clp protease ATP-binding subunit ClpA